MIDLLCMGRSSIDLYSNDSGASFVDIQSFGAFVGGCPTNIAVGAHRLGLRTALLTAVGDDPVGDFVVTFLKREGVVTDYIPRKSGRRTSAVVLGIEPPDRFPLVFYRDNCADSALTISDVDAAPIESCRAVLLSGTGLSAEPSRTATYYAAERAVAQDVPVILDVDFRADQWPDAATYGVNIRRLLPLVSLAIGTREELIAAADRKVTAVIEASQVSSPRVDGDLDHAIQAFHAAGVTTVVEKRGHEGARVHLANGDTVEGAPFVVEVENVLGAGDAFASGFITAWLESSPLEECIQLGNACGAIVVTRQGCANFMPTRSEVASFLEQSR